jgi:hypothetical protein
MQMRLKKPEPAGANAERFVFGFTATGDGPPPAIRVRRMLKTALRCYGLRADWMPQPEPTPTAGEIASDAPEKVPSTGRVE